MHWHVVSHGDDSRAAIEDGTRIIAALFDVGRQRGSPKGSAHLFSYGMSSTLENSKLDWIEGWNQGATSSVITKFPKPSTFAIQSGGKSVAEVYSVIMAGPRMVIPGRSSSRR